MPRFDSPTVFARLLDPAGGTFRVAPVGDSMRTAQRNLPDTNVPDTNVPDTNVPDTNLLVTRIGTADALAEAIDWMPVAARDEPEGGTPQHLVRQLRVRFISPTDPRWLGTLERIGQTPVVDALVFRRPPQEGRGQPGGEEGSFLACSFWYAEALACDRAEWNHSARESPAQING